MWLYCCLSLNVVCEKSTSLNLPTLKEHFIAAEFCQKYHKKFCQKHQSFHFEPTNKDKPCYHLTWNGNSFTFDRTFYGKLGINETLLEPWFLRRKNRILNAFWKKPALHICSMLYCTSDSAVSMLKIQENSANKFIFLLFLATCLT